MIILLRIHFTPEDLGRTRFANGPAPMWEVLLSLHRLAARDGAPVFDDWRRDVRAGLPPTTQWLLEIAPPRGYSPDFLTPAVTAADLEQALAAVLATPPHQLRRELARLAALKALKTQAAALAAALADGTSEALHALATAVRCYYRYALAPYWPQIRASIEADLAARSAVLAHAGVGEVLAGLHPQTRWCNLVLEVPYSGEQHLPLGGRGLLLVPSFFCWGLPVTLKDPALRPVLVYPVGHDLAWMRPPQVRGSAAALAALLGGTRAMMLATIAARGCTTTQLARQTGMSAASASQHATVLREAGLIATSRRGGYAVHTITRLGTSVLSHSIK